MKFPYFLFFSKYRSVCVEAIGAYLSVVRDFEIDGCLILKRLWLIWFVMLGGVSSMLEVSVLDGLAFDPFFF